MTHTWIALASCDPFPPVADDEEPLRAALRRRGFEVFDPPWDDRAFDWSRCAAVLLRCTWDYQRRAPEFLAWCERVATQTRLFHPPEVVRWNIDKRYLRALDVPIAPTTWPVTSIGAAVERPSETNSRNLDPGAESEADRAVNRAAMLAFPPAMLFLQLGTAVAIRRVHTTRRFSARPHGTSGAKRRAGARTIGRPPCAERNLVHARGLCRRDPLLPC